MSLLTEQVKTDVCLAIESMCKKVGGKRLLDVGCWDGEWTVRYRRSAGASEVWGVEFFEAPAKEAEAKGIRVERCDLEEGALPFADGQFDLVVCNQVFEHLKGIFDLLTEIHRVLSVGGYFMFSVPNLASMHNRLILAFGGQPTSIRIIGPHVRGFAYRHTRKFMTLNGLFSVAAVRGCGFYPFPIQLGRLIGRMWPGGSHTFLLVLKKTDKVAPAWSEVVADLGLQSVFTGRDRVDRA